MFVTPRELATWAEAGGLVIERLQGESIDVVRTVRRRAVTLRRGPSTAVTYGARLRKRRAAADPGIFEESGPGSGLGGSDGARMPSWAEPMSPPLHPELLLTHAGALRSMARALLRDEHAAEDVVQETWLRALIAPPPREGGVGGWLRRVAEGFALQRTRAEGRRANRERSYAYERREAIDTEQRSAVLRTVMEAVLALDEPYRETVLLRWFEGLPPRAIAERLRVPVATIDSRLQRAHARLRRTLERESGDEPQRWRGLLALVLGPPPAAPAAPALALPLIGIAMSLKVVSLALVAVIGVCLWVGWDRTGPEVIEPLPVVAANAAADVLAAPVPATLETAREIADGAADEDVVDAESIEAAPAAALEPGPYTFSLRIEVVDSAERPIHGAEVFLGPRSTSTVPFGKTRWDGRLEREWRGFEANFEGVLYVRMGQQQTSLRRVSLVSGEHDVMRFQQDAPTPVSGILLPRCVITRGAVPERPGEFTIDGAGNGVFVDSGFARVVREGTPQEATSAIRTPGSDGEVPAGAFLGVAVDVAGVRIQPAEANPDAPARATIRGAVRDEHGRPIADLVVAARTPDRWNTGIVCDENGEFVFQDVPPGPIEVDAGGGDRILVREILDLAPGESRFVEMRPTLRTNVRVRLLDADSKPLWDWQIEARSLVHEFVTLAVTTTGEDGSAVLSLGGESDVQLFARPLSWKAAPATSLGRHSTSQREALSLRLPFVMRPGTIELRVDGSTSAIAEARAWRVDSGEGEALLRIEDESSAGVESVLRTRPLLPGVWRVETRAPRGAWTELGEVDVAPGESLDLGRVYPTPCASLIVTPADPRRARASYSLRAHVDGALVLWPEHDSVLPLTLETMPAVPIEILCGRGDAARPVSADPLKLPAGAERSVEIAGDD
jgi:RNA polymerase sigma-70 factor (ECF subfamily)